MRFQSLLSYGVALTALWGLVLADSPIVESPESTEPGEIIATANFVEANVFGHVTNGESNMMSIAIENKSNRNVTLQKIAGSFHHPETGRLIKNTTALTYNVPLLEGSKLQIPYQFHSEFKPGDIRLNLWVEHEDEGQNRRVMAYDSIVTIVEPPTSIFDIKLWLTYLIVAGLLGSAGYYTYLTFVPQPKKQRKPQVSAPVGTVTATGAGGYQEEWIPEHHLKKPKAKKTKSGVATSGDETSGAELSATEGKRRKGKK